MSAKPRPARPEDNWFSLLVVAAVGVYVSIASVALLAFTATGQAITLISFFQATGTLLPTWLTLVEAGLCWRVYRQFGPGEPMRKAWSLILASACLGALGAAYSQLLSIDSILNPLTHLAVWSPAMGAKVRNLGLAFGGPLRFSLLAAGLHHVVGVYRKSGFLGRLRFIDRILLAAFGFYIVVEFWTVAGALRHGRAPQLADVLNWPVDPLLWILLGEALLIRRCVQNTGLGLVGRCWTAFSVAIFFTALGEVSLYLLHYGIWWPWTILTCLLWLPAAAFALGPAYQMKAIERATMERAVLQR